jgi:hypothetical protein
MLDAMRNQYESRNTNPNVFTNIREEDPFSRNEFNKRVYVVLTESRASNTDISAVVVPFTYPSRRNRYVGTFVKVDCIDDLSKRIDVPVLRVNLDNSERSNKKQKVVGTQKREHDTFAVSFLGTSRGYHTDTVAKILLSKVLMDFHSLQEDLTVENIDQKISKENIQGLRRIYSDKFSLQNFIRLDKKTTSRWIREMATSLKRPQKKNNDNKTTIDVLNNLVLDDLQNEEEIKFKDHKSFLVSLVKNGMTHWHYAYLLIARVMVDEFYQKNESLSSHEMKETEKHEVCIIKEKLVELCKDKEDFHAELSRKKLLFDEYEEMSED